MRARETADLLGLDATVDRALDEANFGTWRGRSFADVNDESPEAVSQWLTDPDAAPHGGESLRKLHERVEKWLIDQAASDGRTVAITSGGVIKAAVAIALSAPIEATWRIDVTPLARTELHAHDGRWTLTCSNAPLTPVSALRAARNSALDSGGDAPEPAADTANAGGTA